MICMISEVSIRVGEMGFMLCDLYVSLKKPSAGDIKLTNLPCLTSVLPFHILSSEF